MERGKWVLNTSISQGKGFPGSSLLATLHAPWVSCPRAPYLADDYWIMFLTIDDHVGYNP